MPASPWDNNAQIDKNGNLTLGFAGRDDSAGDASYLWAKDDIWVPVSPAELVSTTLPAITRTSVGIYHRTLAASTTHNVIIPLQGGLFRLFSGDVNTSAPHGLKVNSLSIFYRVNTTTITSLSLKVYTVPHAAGSSIYTATEVASTTTGDTLTAAANVYEAKATVTTPTFNNTQDRAIVGEAIIVIPGSSTVDLLGAVWRVSLALY